MARLVEVLSPRLLPFHPPRKLLPLYGFVHWLLDYFASLSPELKARMIACARSGFENPDSGMGAYAIQPDDYVRSLASGALARDPPPPPPVAIDFARVLALTRLCVIRMMCVPAPRRTS